MMKTPVDADHYKAPCMYVCMHVCVLAHILNALKRIGCVYVCVCMYGHAKKRMIVHTKLDGDLNLYCSMQGGDDYA
jgi:hypothetical protein